MSQGKNVTQNNKINNLPSEKKTTTTMYNGEEEPKVQKVKSSDPVHFKVECLATGEAVDKFKQ